MNRFRFRLESVLRVRGAQEVAKKREFGTAVGHLVREEKRLEEIVNDIETTDRVRGDAGKGKITIRDLINGFFFTRFLEKRKSDQEKEIEKAQTNVEEKRQELIEVRKKRQTLERLKEHALEDYNHAVLKEEQALIDETATLRFNSPSETS